MKSGDELISVVRYPFTATEGLTDAIELCTETQVPAVQASATPAQAGANNDVVWTAQTPSYEGTKGNALSIEYLNTGNSKPLAVDVIAGVGGQEAKVSVQLATDSGGTITSIANDVIDAVAAHPQASSMMYGKNSGADTGAGLAVAVAATSLTGGVDSYPAAAVKVVTAPVQASVTPAQAGGNNDILWTAQSPNYIGTKGNALQVELLADTVLAVDVIAGAGGQETKVSIKINNTVTTANQVIDAVAAHPQAKEMMFGKATEGTGDGASVAVAATSLAGGLDEALAVNHASIVNTDRVQIDFLSHAQ
jgi:hypothetical protein